MFHRKRTLAIVTTMTRSIAFIAACVVMMSAANVCAAIITQPTSLSPGDTYRLAFVTSAARDATSTNIADYNTFVTNAANFVPALASLGTTWTAIGSTATVEARDNTNTVPSTAGGSLGVPIFLLNDTKLVDSNDDLWDGSIDLPLNRTELDTAIVAQVWTGTTSAGLADSADFDQDGDTDGTDFLSWQRGLGIVAPNATKADGDADDDLDVDTDDFDIWQLQYGSADPPIPLGSTFSIAVVGRTDQTSSGWIHATTATPTTIDRPVYAISGELLVIPEPATCMLLLIGLVVLGRGARRQLFDSDVLQGLCHTPRAPPVRTPTQSCKSAAETANAKTIVYQDLLFIFIYFRRKHHVYSSLFHPVCGRARLGPDDDHSSPRFANAGCASRHSPMRFAVYSHACG